MSVRFVSEKAKQEQQQLSKERQDREKSGLPKSNALPPIYNENFARRAGEIIARAIRAAGQRS
jgi:hypothetical protein